MGLVALADCPEALGGPGCNHVVGVEGVDRSVLEDVHDRLRDRA